VLAIHLLTLAGSAGLLGVFVRRVLGEQGYAPGFGMGILLACGIAASYIAAELLFLALLRLIWPTKSSRSLIADSLTHATALVLIPYLANVNVSWPHPIFERVEPLVYVGTFVALHLALKLLLVYSVLQSEPGSSTWALGWLGGGAVSALAAYLCLNGWLGGLGGLQPRAPEESQPYSLGSQVVTARMMPEGAVYETILESYPGQSLTFHWSNAPNAAPENQLDRVYVTLSMKGETSNRYQTTVDLSEEAWAQLRVPANQVPSGATSCTVSWLSEEEPAWQSVVGIRPAVSSNLAVLMSGPYQHEARADSIGGAPNLVVILVERLGANRVSGLGYRLNTTPSLERFAKANVSFSKAYTVAPEPEAAAMSLLTGLDPLQHGFLGGHRGSLPEGAATLAEALRRAHYYTAAFTESDARKDLLYGTGFERGFDLYDTAYPLPTKANRRGAPTADAGAEPTTPPATASQATLERVRQFIEANKDVKFALFVRLSELRDPQIQERYGTGFLPPSRPPTPDHIYDTAAHFLDSQIGAVTSLLGPQEFRAHTCIVITSTQGAEFAPLPPLTDGVLRVPLIISAPGEDPAPRTDVVSTLAVAPTLARLACVELGPASAGRSLLAEPRNDEPISLNGDPLMLSIASGRWRLTWSTQQHPFSFDSLGPEAVPALYDLMRPASGRAPTDYASRNMDTVRSLHAKLQQFLNSREPDRRRHATR
jgi:hypothetical protein